MAGFVFFLFFVAAMITVGSFVARRAGVRVHDSTGHAVPIGPPAGFGRIALGVLGGLFVLLLLATTIRVVPVGHALVIFNTVTKGFRLARQGITFVPPFISETEDYDLRRLEYTMSGATGEGRKADIDDSLWSPTQEGLRSASTSPCGTTSIPRAVVADPPEDRPRLRGEDHPPGGALGDPSRHLRVRGDGRVLGEARADPGRDQHQGQGARREGRLHDRRGRAARRALHARVHARRSRPSRSRSSRPSR